MMKMAKKLFILIIFMVTLIISCNEENKNFTEKNVESLSLKRYRTKWKSKWTDSRHHQACNVSFKYSDINGIGYEKGVSRRDPSSIIKIGNLYYVWYTKAKEISSTKTVSSEESWDPTPFAWTWDPASIWYATSYDGKKWTEQSEAVAPGPEGSFDDSSVFTADVLVANGKYYLYYQTHCSRDTYGKIKSRYGSHINIAMACAVSPNGPWIKAPEPILSPGNRNKGDWDTCVVHDPTLIVRDGMYMLYYKGRFHRGPMKRFIDGDLKDWTERSGGIPIGWGIALADKPEGPFIKSNLNPVIIGGHECIVWPHGDGVYALLSQGPEKYTVQYAKDGINFDVVGYVNKMPEAAGIFRANCFVDILKKPAEGINWGLFHKNKEKSFIMYLQRFDCNWCIEIP